jgi:hypothetical protein
LKSKMRELGFSRFFPGQLAGPHWCMPLPTDFRP